LLRQPLSIKKSSAGTAQWSRYGAGTGTGTGTITFSKVGTGTGITPDFSLFKQFLSKGRLRNLQFKGKEV
jgi:hypothetical protein